MQKIFLLNIYFEPKQRWVNENSPNSGAWNVDSKIKQAKEFQQNPNKQEEFRNLLDQIKKENSEVSADLEQKIMTEIEKSGSKMNSIVDKYLQKFGEEKYFDELQKDQEYQQLMSESMDLSSMLTEAQDLRSEYEQKKSETVNNSLESLNNLKSTIGTAETIERTESDKKFWNMIYKLNRWNEKFDQIMVDISSGNYEQAFANMDNFKDVKSFVTDGDGNFDTKKMQELLTYSYGSVEVKNMTWTVSESLYKKSRTEKVLTAESDVMKNFAGVDISPNEDAFNKWEHIPTNASNLFPEQAISTSVVATPKGGTHRLDHFNFSIDISSQTADINSPELKQSLLNAYEWQVDSELQKINSTLWTEISKEDYKSMILWEKTPDSVVPWLAFKAEPKFFEGRAMLKHNVCNNLTYWLAFPTFNLEEVKKPQPKKIDKTVYDDKYYGVGENRHDDRGRQETKEKDNPSTDPRGWNDRETVDRTPDSKGSENTDNSHNTEVSSSESMNAWDQGDNSKNNSSTETNTDSSSQVGSDNVQNETI